MELVCTNWEGGGGGGGRDENRDSTVGSSGGVGQVPPFIGSSEAFNRKKVKYRYRTGFRSKLLTELLTGEISYLISQNGTGQGGLQARPPANKTLRGEDEKVNASEEVTK
jgi:hypothetical protein